VALPQLKDILGRVTSDLTPGGISPSVQAAFGTARTGINKDFATEGRAEKAYLNQAAAQSGGIFNTNQLSDAQVMAAHNLDTERRNAQRNLDFQEASAGMGQFNTLINLLSGGSGAALGIGSGFGAAQAQAIGGYSSSSPGQGALAGAASGAAIGSQLYPGWGTAIGGVLGAAGGYFGSGG